jgi:hypothetical protein
LSRSLKLLPTQTDEAFLSALGKEACSMLMQRDYAGLACRFGYALAYGREIAAAIEADFVTAVASPINEAPEESPSIVLTYFTPNSTGLFAAVDCTVSIGEAASVYLSLVIAGAGNDKYVTLEDIRGVAW